MKKVIRWGVISTAKIGREKVIPAIQESKYSKITAIASENEFLVRSIATQNNIEKCYNNYDAILNDANIDVVYIPLPNHLHVKWAIKALKAGKHVLCEKPIGVDANEAMQLYHESLNYPNQKIMEAFMYRFHPQWQKVKSLIQEGVIGKVKTVHTFFSYYNVDPNNIRNRPDVAGGTLMDIGCYCVSFPRFIFDAEPVRVMGLMDKDPEMKTDRFTSGMLDFTDGKVATFTCSTQLMPYQRVQILGDEGHIEVEIPVNAPIDSATFVRLRAKSHAEEFKFSPVNQYTLQADYFSQSILDDTDIQFDLKDSIANMKVIDAIVKSSNENSWITIEKTIY